MYVLPECQMARKKCLHQIDEDIYFSWVKTW